MLGIRPSWLFSICLLGLAVPLAALAESPAVTIPESPAGAALVEWLGVVRAGDAEEARQHYDDRFGDAFKSKVGPDGYMGVFGQVAALVGAKPPERIVADGPLALSAYVQAVGVGWLEIRIVVDEAAPHKINGLLIRPGEPPAEAAAAPAADWKNVGELLERVRATHGFPALAGAWIRDGKVVDQAVVGVRQVGTEDKAATGDLFHVGSVTKSITATMIGKLVEEGKLAWDLKLAAALPGIEMRPEYRDVTLEQLLWHRGGIPTALGFDDAEMKRLVGLPGTPTEQRAAFVREILQKEPVAPPGTEHRYSNAGYAIAGYIAERATGESWSALVRSRVFDPLGMKSAGFGWPATEARPNQPRGHYREGETLRAQGLDEYPLGEFLDPAGDVNCSIADLARFAEFHLAKLRAPEGAPGASIVKRLHTPPSGGDYASGWVIRKLDDGTSCHWHNGSAGTFYALVTLFPESNQAVVVAANAGTWVESAAVQLAEILRQRGLKAGEGP